MELTASKVSELLEQQLSRISDQQVRILIRKLLVPPRSELRPSDYGPPGTEYPCWIVVEHGPSKTGIAYCEQGFGPRCPWGLLWISGERTSIGADSGWFGSLEEAVRESFAFLELEQ